MIIRDLRNRLLEITPWVYLENDTKNKLLYIKMYSNKGKKFIDDSISYKKLKSLIKETEINEYLKKFQ